VLTDEDLKALVDWTNAKSALRRFREGWGVATGLEVTASHNANESARVYVAPGYAVDACGRDIVVCKPIHYDFKCDPAFDPCCPEKSTRQPQPNDITGDLACLPFTELRAFELCLTFDEQQSGGQRAIVRGNCQPLADCQATRITETGKLGAREIKTPCAKPVENQTQDNYRSELNRFVAQLARLSSAEDLRDWARNKLHTFAFVEDCICKAIQGVSTKQKGASRGTDIDPNWLFYLVQDWRTHYFQGLGKTKTNDWCDGDSVPLARVWVRQKSEGNCKVCKVVYIDAYPPYRRLLRPEGGVFETGCVDLSRYVWRDIDEVQLELRNTGVTVTPEELTEPKMIEYVERLRKGEIAEDLICAMPGSNLRLRWWTDFCERRRVVDFMIT
jgi:hypothetical protein